MAIFKCKICGGTIEFEPGATVGVCDSCGTRQTLPRLDDDKKANLYDRANHFRRNNEYDKATGIYEQILNEDRMDAEAYWSLVLCRYGVEYVEDPVSHKRVPTVNRTQFTSVFADEDYKSALQYADAAQKAIYENDAKAIDEIQKGILSISEKEKPFDIFICYKETDQNGRRTQDSVLANDLFHHLTQEGFKVFFSRITLEDKLGTAYEPYIFAALNSSKIMIVLGTRPEYFNAVWVRNEWSRYLALVKQSNGKKMLIPAYKDMDPYDLPEEFSHLQAQDMGKLGFMQDLIRGIKKIIQADVLEPATARETVVYSGNANIAPLLKRVFMFLEDKDWESADEYCERVLDVDPENAQAYLGKLMAKLRIRKQEGLKYCKESFEYDSNYEKIMRFGDDKLKATLKGYTEYITTRNENERREGIYKHALELKQNAFTEDDYKHTADLFESISGYLDSYAQAVESRHKAEDARQRKIKEIEAAAEAEQLERERQAEEQRIKAEKRRKQTIIAVAIAVVVIIIAYLGPLVFNSAGKYIMSASKYKAAEKLQANQDYIGAAVAFGSAGDYKDARTRSMELWNEIADRSVLSADRHTVGLRSNGTVTAVGNDDKGQDDVADWMDIVAVATGEYHTVGLRSDGTVVAVGDNDHGQCDVDDWTDIVAVVAGEQHTVGLRSDGTVVAVGYNCLNQCNVDGWTDIVAVAAGGYHTVGLRSDGTVVAVGDNGRCQCGVGDWTDIVAVAAGGYHTVGLHSDGTVVAVGHNGFNQCDVDGWADIVAVAAGEYHTVGLRSDGTVVAVSYNGFGESNVDGWTDIVAVAAGEFHTVGLRSDGTVVAVGNNDYGQCDVDGWTGIRIPEKTLGRKRP